MTTLNVESNFRSVDSLLLQLNITVKILMLKSLDSRVPNWASQRLVHLLRILRRVQTLREKFHQSLLKAIELCQEKVGFDRNEFCGMI